MKNTVALIIGAPFVIAFALSLIIGVSLLEAKVLLDLWKWFVWPDLVNFEMSLFRMWGLDLLVGVFVYNGSTALLTDLYKKQDKWIGLKPIWNKITALLFTWLIAYCGYKLFHN